MPGIEPTYGPSPHPLGAPGLQGVEKTPAGRPGQDDSAGGFGKVLKAAVDGVDADQQQSVSAVQELLTGKTENVLPVISAVAKADMSFKLLLGVRNKMVEAYKQTMNMQI